MTDEPFKGLQEMLDERKERRVQDGKTFLSHDENICMMCLVRGQDKRSLRISCMYDIGEVVPEMLDLGSIMDEAGGTHYARICKDCRGRLLDSLKLWREECVAKRGTEMDMDGNPEDINPAADIPLRKNGRIVMLTQAEWDALHPGEEPCRLKKEGTP